MMNPAEVIPVVLAVLSLSGSLALGWAVRELLR